MVEPILFYGVAFLILLCSAMVVLARNPVASAIFLVVDLFLLASTYAMLGADFAAAIQVLVYAGAIMVLFVFVIMLLNLQPDSEHGFLSHLRLAPLEVFMLFMTFIGFVVMGFAMYNAPGIGVKGSHTEEAIAASGGNTVAVGRAMFSEYLWPFELASVLILLAIVASIVIAKKPHASESSKD